MAEIGDLVKINDYEGILMPSDGKITIIKLSSGYNMAFKNAKINLIKKKEEVKKEKHGTIKKNPKLKNISILHCGGTVASKVDYKTGGVTAQFAPDELLQLFPEIKDIANIESKLIAQMMSENMRFTHYNLIAKAIEEEIKKGVDGIIVTHGTDTLHYTSAALAFMLENLPIPVLLVGSQRSSDRGSSDAAMNLISAISFITNSDFGDVAICMHAGTNDDDCLVLSATKTRKMHTSRRDAFRPINIKPYARINYTTKEITYLNNNFKKRSNTKLKVMPFKEDLKIGLFKSHTNLYAEELDVYKNFDGLVVEGTGLGQLPNSVVDNSTEESGKIIEKIEELTKKIPVVMTSQCVYGRIDMNVYSEGRINMGAGIIGNNLDMTPETAFIKLAWLLSNKLDVKEYFPKNLRGEISERIENIFLI